MQAIKQYAEEGKFDENSNVIAIFPDHGSRYMSKVFSDDWMNKQVFLTVSIKNKFKKLNFSFALFFDFFYF